MFKPLLLMPLDEVSAGRHDPAIPHSVLPAASGVGGSVALPRTALLSVLP